MSPHSSTFTQLQYCLWREKQTIYFMKTHSNSSPHLETKSSKHKNKTNTNANPTVIIRYFNLTRYFDVCQVCIELDTILDISVNLQMLFIFPDQLQVSTLWNKLKKLSHVLVTFPRDLWSITEPTSNLQAIEIQCDQPRVVMVTMKIIITFNNFH